MGYLESLMSENERAVFITRRHWVTLVPGLALHVLMALVVIAIAVFVYLHEKQPLALLILVLILYPIIRILVAILRWKNEMFVVTNRRVIEVRGVYSKYVADSALEKVNDVVLYQSAMGRLYNYGDVEIVTGSDIGVNRFSRIAQPIRFKTEMLNQKAHLGVHTDEDLSEGRPTVMATGGQTAHLLEDLARLRANGVLTEQEFQEKKKKLLARM